MSDLEIFIPELWSDRLNKNMNKALVYGGLVNRDYEGEISRMGDTVHIQELGDVTVGTYSKDGAVTTIQQLAGTTQTLTINQFKDFNIYIDDIDKVQETPKLLNKYMGRAGYATANVQDQFLAALNSGVDAANIVGLGSTGTPVVPTTSTIYALWTQAGMLLDEANVPNFGRWSVIPAWMKKMFLDSDDFTPASDLGDAVKTTGFIGNVAGFDIHMSNNVPNDAGAKYKVMFGTNDAITLADQWVNVEAYRPEAKHADAIKGLNIYGAKLLQSTGIAVGTFSKT